MTRRIFFVSEPGPRPSQDAADGPMLARWTPKTPTKKTEALAGGSTTTHDRGGGREGGREGGSLDCRLCGLRDEAMRKIQWV